MVNCLRNPRFEMCYKRRPPCFVVLIKKHDELTVFAIFQSIRRNIYDYIQYLFIYLSCKITIKNKFCTYIFGDRKNCFTNYFKYILNNSFFYLFDFIYSVCRLYLLIDFHLWQRLLWDFPFFCFSRNVNICGTRKDEQCTEFAQFYH